LTKSPAFDYFLLPKNFATPRPFFKGPSYFFNSIVFYGLRGGLSDVFVYGYKFVFGAKRKDIGFLESSYTFIRSFKGKLD